MLSSAANATANAILALAVEALAVAVVEKVDTLLQFIHLSPSFSIHSLPSTTVGIGRQ